MTASFTLLQLMGAVALLIWGLRMIRTAAERAFGSGLDCHLRCVAGSPTRAFLFGTAGAAVLQSSTALVLLATGFVARARVPLVAGLAIALGADLGSAVAARILSLDIAPVAPAALLVGCVVFQVADSKRRRNLGRALLGLGLVLMALGQIVAVGAQVQAAEPVQVLVGAIAGEPALAILLAAGLTWLMHSSLAMVLLIASLAATGVIGGSAALYMLLGANLGAALPALVGALAELPAGRRVPLGNLVFRSAGVLATIWWVDALHAALASQGVSGGTMVILGHLGFNAALGLIALPLVPAMARLLEWAVPAADQTQNSRAVPRYLDRAALATPVRALANARREGLRLADLVQEMVDASEAALSPLSPADRLAAISATEEDVDALNNAIKFYVTELTRAPLSMDHSRQAHSVIAFATNMEHIGDIVHRNINRLAGRKARLGVDFSDEGAAEISEIYERVREAMQTATSAFMADDEVLAEQLIAQKRDFRAEELSANHRHLERLREGNEASIDTSAIHLDLLRDLKGIHSHLTAIAYTIIQREAPDFRRSA